jgi:hypothetical protein
MEEFANFIHAHKIANSMPGAIFHFPPGKSAASYA